MRTKPKPMIYGLYLITDDDCDGGLEQRVAAATTLAEIADPAVIKPLLGALKDSDALVRTAADESERSGCLAALRR